MLGKMVAALVGAEVERKRRQSGLKGAVVGAMAYGVIRRMGPLGLVLGGAWAAKRAYDRSKQA